MPEFDPVSYMMGARSGGGGGGSSTLSGLTDVDISNPSDGQTLVYNATSGKWENSSPLLIIGATYDENEDRVTLDKTWNEINNALLSRSAIGQIFLNYGVPVESVQIMNISMCAFRDGAYVVDTFDGPTLGCWDPDAYPTDPLPPEPIGGRRL